MIRAIALIFVSLCVAGSSDAASDVCSTLTSQKWHGKIAIAPISCEPALAADCANISEQVVRCLQGGGAKVMTPAGVRAVMDEHVVGQVLLGASSDKLMEIAGALGASYIVVTQVNRVGGETLGLVRVIASEDGAVQAAARITIGSTGPTTGEVSSASVDQSLASLATKLATSYAALAGGGGRRRLAVLDFTENGELAKKNKLGTLVAAELITRFRRDFGLSLVERAKLQSVLKELELGQTGAIDDKLAPKLGKLLDADAIVIGAANDAGPAIRVNAQIVDVTTGATLIADAVQLPAAGMIALSSDALVLRSKSGAVFRSLLVPGWGQLYNRQAAKGYGVLGAVVLSAGTAIGSEILALSAQGSYDKAKVGANFDQLAQRIDNFYLARDIALGVMAAVWVYNIIDAYANGVTFDSAVGTQVGGPSVGVSVSVTPAGISGVF